MPPVALVPVAPFDVTTSSVEFDNSMFLPSAMSEGGLLCNRLCSLPAVSSPTTPTIVPIFLIIPSMMLVVGSVSSSSMSCSLY